MLKYKLDGKEYHASESPLTVQRILEDAGHSSTEQLFLEDSSGHQYSDKADVVAISPDVVLVLEVKKHKEVQVFHFKLNGEEQTASKPQLSVKQILEQAGSDAGISQELITNYYIENVGTEQRFNDLGDMVDIRAGDEFVAIYKGKTTVATVRESSSDD